MTRGEPLFLGVDGGGTGCRVALWNAGGTLLARADGGPANVSSDFDGACGHILAAIAEVEAVAGQSVTRAVAHLGLAGVMSPKTGAAVAARMPMVRCRVTDDRPTTIAGALGGADGAVLAVGTGSFVGVQRDGQVRAVGGWGFQVSDNASAAWIGRAGLAATLDAVDGLAPHGAMAQALLQRFGGDPNAIVAFAAVARPVEYGALAPLVLGAGDDPAALAILGQGAEWLDRALHALDHDDTLPLCLIGGLGPRYRAALDRPGRRFVAPKGTALDGALVLARGAT